MERLITDNFQCKFDCLTIIPARSGSKGLPGKNLFDLSGKPLVAWTIEAALNAKINHHVIVSTDCHKIANISKKFGASIPFLRPNEFATDTASSEQLVLHAIDFFLQKKIYFQYIMLLQPTSPLRTSKDIETAFDIILKTNNSSCVSICENDHSPYNYFFLNNNKLKRVLPQQASSRRQDHPKTYRTNGAIYIAKTNWFLEKQLFIDTRTAYYEMPLKRSIDIDTEVDILVASALIRS